MRQRVWLGSVAQRWTRRSVFARPHDVDSTAVCVAGPAPVDGSVLLPYAGRGKAEGYFISLKQDSTLRGFVIYYPENIATAVPAACLGVCSCLSFSLAR